MMAKVTTPRRGQEERRARAEDYRKPSKVLLMGRRHLRRRRSPTAVMLKLNTTNPVASIFIAYRTVSTYRRYFTTYLVTSYLYVGVSSMRGRKKMCHTHEITYVFLCGKGGKFACCSPLTARHEILPEVPHSLSQ